jgi:DNA primase
MTTPGSPAELIKQKLDVADVLRGYITLIPAGKNFKALCPFHKEKSPSFSVSPERQSWHCFGCSKGGDIFTFVMEHENVEFGEALKILAEKAGVELRKINPAEYKYLGLLYDLNDQAKDFFKQELAAGATPIAIEARAYLVERKLSAETIAEFDIGWAPADMDKLVKFFLAKGVAPDDLVRSGLVGKTDRGSLYDRFRGRIMFPIHNHLGKVVGFTGRILPSLDKGETGKYVNSPETSIFNKSKLLYGFFKAKSHIREAKRAFLVEGQMDMLMSYQAGVKYAVASSGTAFTADHMQLLSRATEEIVVSFDNDTAGLEAGERAIDLAESKDFRVSVARLEGGVKDPAEAVAKDPKLLTDAIEHAIPAMEFYFEKYLGKGGSGGAARTFDLRSRDSLRALRAVLRKIKTVASPVERSFWMKELSKRTGADEDALKDEANKIEMPEEARPRPMNNAQADAAPSEMPQNATMTATDFASRTLTRRALLVEQLITGAIAAGNFDLLTDAASYIMPPYTNLVVLLQSGARRHDDPKIDGLLNYLILRSEPVPPEEMVILKRELAAESAKDRRRELVLEVRRAEEDGDDTALEAAMKALGDLPLA